MAVEVEIDPELLKSEIKKTCLGLALAARIRAAQPPITVAQEVRLRLLRRAD
jgi:hypothetical protein